MTRSFTRRNFLLTAGGAVVATTVATKAQTKAATSASPFSKAFIDQLPKLMEWANVPGLAIAVIENGKLAWSRGFGVKKAGESAPVTNETLFGAASLSKPVLTYAVLRMRDEKLIELDRPLWTYLSYEDLPAGDQAKQITTRHVLSHSTGLQNWRFNRDQKLEFAFKPGERFQYSGEGFYYLQRVLEQITGRGFEEYMQERVLKRLGMTSSTFSWTAASESRMAWGHNGRMISQEAFNAQRGKRMLELAEEWKKPVASWKHEDVVRANGVIAPGSPAFPNSLLPNTAGSLITTANEYALFMSRLMARSQRDDLDLTETSRREMLTMQTKINSAVSWGLGIGLESYAGRSLFWHWGDNGTFKAFTMGDPANGSGVIIFANAQNGHRIWQRVAAEAMGRDHPAFYFFMT